MSIEAMKQALEKATEVMEAACIRVDELKAENESLRQAIAEAEKQDHIRDATKMVEQEHEWLCGECIRCGASIEKHEVSQEPVAWKDMAFTRLGAVRDKMHPDDVATVQRFLNGDYTHPPVPQGHEPKREWVGLTDDEVQGFADQYWGDDNMTMHSMFRAIEAKLKEKNT